MSFDAEHCVSLGPEEVEELYWLLGQLEDWLLGTGEETLAELADFVDQRDPRAARHVIERLGRYTVELRRRSTGERA